MEEEIRKKRFLDCRVRFMEEVNPKEFIEQLTCLTKSLEEEVHCWQDREGARHAAFRLAMELVKKDNWYADVIRALRKANKNGLADAIEGKQDKPIGGASRSGPRPDGGRDDGMDGAWNAEESGISDGTVSSITEEREHFTETSRTREQAVKEWLEYLETKQHDDGIYQQVLQALIASGQQHIAEMLEDGKVVPDEIIQQRRDLVRIFFPRLVTVSPIEMLPWLMCLSDEEQNAIQACKDQHGDHPAAMKMVFYLVLKGKEMYGQLINALSKAKHELLAKDLQDMINQDYDPTSDKDFPDISADDDNSKPADAGDQQQQNDSTAGGDLNNLASESLSNERTSQPTGPLNVEIHKDSETVDHQDQEESNRQGPQHENDSDASNVSPPSTKELKLRSYQMELAKPALSGPNGSKNTIIVAPTGSGKTIVALKVAMDFLDSTRSPGGASGNALPSKVVFLVNQTALVEQQSKLFTNYLGSDGVIGLSGGETSHGPLKSILEAKSVLVMTAQILVNGLQDHSVELSHIGLLILDECHNCQKNAPYNKIMAAYRDMKLDSKHPRPQILGMTASLDIGQAKSEYQAESKILQQCANLDAELSTVQSQECLEELAQYQNIPTEDIIEVKGRPTDRFAKVINTIMEKIEEVIECTEEWDTLQAHNPQLKIPSSRGNQPYEQWVVQMQDGIAVTVKAPDDKDTRRRKLMACTDHLKVYNNSLYINRDIRTVDALSQLDEFMAEIIKHKDDWNKLTDEEQQTKENPLDETDEFLLKIFNDRRTELEAISVHPNSRNPVLEKLGDVLLKAFETKEGVPEKRGILFTKTRASTEALRKWIEETEHLKWLKPGTLIGGGGTGGMTQRQQINLLELFREGDHKLIVATSVAQEGLDIAQCNVVVRYNYVSSVVAHVQAKGRNRAMGGQFFLVVDEQLKLKDKDLMNRIREPMMLRATKTIQKRLTQEKELFLEQIKELQRIDQVERKLKNEQDANKSKSKVKTGVKLTCRKCGVLACYNDDIRCANGAHHVVIIDKFRQLYDTKDDPKLPVEVDDFYFQKICVCKKCKTEWGKIGKHKGITMPFLTPKGFILEYPNGKQQKVSQWKDVMFEVAPFTAEDLKKIVNTDENEMEDEGDEARNDADKE
ncbi:ATP-dependent RNA helicase DHX58-like [Amphiura filiformis]|uniref:ATP-dependent RNA helicase DHX58-like n=1 Tax=Amphiura filiformis TaxID=82378 RepID=UPI003B226DFA